MAYPEFSSGAAKVLFFSRGKGWGHAVPDIEIARRLQRDDPGAEVRFVSYAGGADAFEAHRLPVIDVGFPEFGSLVDMTVAAGRLIGWLKPDLVVSHEEYAALPAAKIFHRPTVFLTDWFAASERYEMSSLKFADEILFIGPEGRFEEPEWVRGKVRYTGPVFREFAYSVADRRKARRELGIPEEATVVSVLPGSWREEQAPLAGRLLEAFATLPRPRRLIWLAGADEDGLRRRFGDDAEVLVLGRELQVERLMVAADVGVTKSNRKTVFELCHLGVPSVAVTWGLNRMDDIAIAGLEGVTVLRDREADSRSLAAGLTGILGQAGPVKTQRFPDTGADECARRIGAALAAAREGGATNFS